MTKQELYQKACALPLLPGVYIIRDKSGEIIYIGKAKRLRTRVSQYFREGVPHDAKVTQMIRHAFEFDVIVTTSEFEALVLEASQIKPHTPKYNILLKDDKGYSYVRVSHGPWPRITAALQMEEDGAEYWVPTPPALRSTKQMVETALNISFRLPTCEPAVSCRFPQRPPLSQRPYRALHGGLHRQDHRWSSTRRAWRGLCDDPSGQIRDPQKPAPADGGRRRAAGF